MSQERQNRSRWLVAAIVFSCYALSVQAFSISMEYRPPVKSSVNKLRTSRFGGGGTPSENPRQRSTTSKSAYAGALQAPSNFIPNQQSSSSGSNSFENRMRNLVLSKPKEVDRKLPTNLKVIETLQDYKKVVADEDERIVAVRFYAPWCKACKRIEPMFYHMATHYPDVVFVDVPVTAENAKLHQGLKVPALPYGHIYHPKAGLVEESRIVRKLFPAFAHKLESYIEGSCNVDIES